MKRMPRLCFYRSDIIMNIDSNTDFDTLLKLALKGGAGNGDNMAQKIRNIKANFSEEAIGSALYDAAQKAAFRENAAIRRQLNREFAWRVGYYLAISLGTAKNYPPEP